MNNDEFLHKTYYDAKNGYMNQQALINIAKKQGIDEAYTREWYKRQRPNQIIARKVEHKILHRIINPENAYIIDIAFLPKYTKQNRGYNAMLIILEGTSRYAFVYPLKHKSDDDIIPIIQKFIKENKVEYITTDNEKAFLSNQFKNVTQGITHFLVEPDDHYSMGMLDRFVRTLKELVEKYFVANNTVVWIDVIDDIVHNYNNRIHSTLKTTPNDAYLDFTTRDELRMRLAKSDEKAQIKKREFNIGDFVRYLKHKKVFEKGESKYSTKFYRIKRIEANSFILESPSGHEKEKTFRYHQLRKVSPIEDETNNISLANKQYKRDKIREKEAEQLQGKYNATEKKIEVNKRLVPKDAKRQRKPKKFFDE